MVHKEAHRKPYWEHMVQRKTIREDELEFEIVLTVTKLDLSSFNCDSFNVSGKKEVQVKMSPQKTPPKPKIRQPSEGQAITAGVKTKKPPAPKEKKEKENQLVRVKNTFQPKVRAGSEMDKARKAAREKSKALLERIVFIVEGPNGKRTISRTPPEPREEPKPKRNNNVIRHVSIWLAIFKNYLHVREVQGVNRRKRRRKKTNWSELRIPSSR
eukprot:sb/3470100/